jgi:hypothetical protein
MQSTLLAVEMRALCCGRGLPPGPGRIQALRRMLVMWLTVGLGVSVILNVLLAIGLHESHPCNTLYNWFLENTWGPGEDDEVTTFHLSMSAIHVQNFENLT